IFVIFIVFERKHGFFLLILVILFHFLETNLPTEEINRRLGGTQIKVPSVDQLQDAYKIHNLGEGKKLSKDEFQKLLQEVLIGAGFTGVGGIKEFLLFIFGVPVLAVFLKNRIAPTSITNDVFIPAVTSATVFLLAKLNKI
ncbi:hypothetical protein CARUB_v10025091mg, partial [Capsella rubella]